jgi:hypothetical protein
MPSDRAVQSIQPLHDVGGTNTKLGERFDYRVSELSLYLVSAMPYPFNPFSNGSIHL